MREDCDFGTPCVPFWVLVGFAEDAEDERCGGGDAG